MDKIKLELTESEATLVSIAILNYQISVGVSIQKGKHNDPLLAKNNNIKFNSILEKLKKAVTPKA